MKKLSLLFFPLFWLHSVNANLLVTPTRVELEPKYNRSAVFSIVNRSSELTRYNIFFEDKFQKTDGTYQTKDSDAVLSKLIRYSPRRLTLQPSQGADVRLALRLPKSFPEGEYRSYIVFKQIPNQVDNTFDEQSENIAIKITALMRISIPVILRVGQLESDISFVSNNNFTLESKDNGYELALSINRLGGRSSIGDLEVFYLDDGKEYIVGSSRNSAIYPEINQKHYNIKLSNYIPGKPLNIRFKEHSHLFKPKIIQTQVTL